MLFILAVIIMSMSKLRVARSKDHYEFHLSLSRWIDIGIVITYVKVLDKHTAVAMVSWHIISSLFGDFKTWDLKGV